MEFFAKDRARQLCILVAFSIVFLFGCQSTPTEDQEDPETCQAENAEDCSGEDRGFNPCRINNNLPVCKK
ncbi:MAG: hypothetical protein ACI88A_001787 [Paraglaciecola sp.]|jgi:hypothetical protein